MLTIKNPDKSNRKTATTLQSEFAKLQSAIKRQQNRNRSLHDDLQGLVQYYQERILPRERDLVFPVKELIQRLMEMYPRKALTQWQRQELTDWIFDEIQHLAMLDADAARELATAFQSVMADFFKLSAEDIAEREAHAEREMQHVDEDVEDDDAFEELLRSADQNGKLRVPDPLSAADQFFCLIKGGANFRLLIGCGEALQGAEAEAHVRDAVDVFLRAFRAEQAS